MTKQGIIKQFDKLIYNEKFLAGCSAISAQIDYLESEVEE